MSERAGIRERVEEIERASLSTWASLASESKGRDRLEDPDPLRTGFHQDRDRLLDTEAFERLAGKTDRFVPGASQRGWRSRLAHTLAAGQLARMLARGLRLNEDLAEAVALGHALGAPPFGPAGEAVIAELVDGASSVGEQSLRVVERLARGGRGLNLTWEVRDGILHHAELQAASTLEGRVAALAVRLARLLHGLTAAQGSGVVSLDDVPRSVREGLGCDHAGRVAAVVEDVLRTSTDRPEIGVSAEVERVLAALEGFLEEAVHARDAAAAEAERAAHCLQSLAIYQRARPSSLGESGHASEDVTSRVVDHLTALTDDEAGAAFVRTFRPTGRLDA